MRLPAFVIDDPNVCRSGRINDIRYQRQGTVRYLIQEDFCHKDIYEENEAV